MLDDLGRPGRAGGGSFCGYDESGTRMRLWPGLRNAFTSGSADVPFVDIQERMLFAEALETARCIEEGVLNSVADANIGSILGIGFPAWTGGVVQYMNQYDGGLAGFVERARALAARYSDGVLDHIAWWTKASPAAKPTVRPANSLPNTPSKCTAASGT